MTRPSAPLKKLEKDVMRAAMLVYEIFMMNPGFMKELKGNRRLMAKMLHACHRLAQRKPK